MSHLLADYAWYELMSPVSLAAAVLLCYWYIKKVIKSPHFTAKNGQKMYFFIAVSLFYLVTGTPFAVIADDYLISLLILKLSVMTFIAVPLFILALPQQYLKMVFWHHKRFRIAKRILAHPWPLAVIFNGLITAFLIPSLFSVITGNWLLQFVYEVLLVTFAIFTWWVIIQPLEQVAQHSYFVRTAYVFFTALFLMPIGIFLLVVQDPLYASYAAVLNGMWPAFTAVYDQQLAGGLLKILQLSSYSFALFYLLKNWGLHEEENEGKVDDNTRVVQGVVIHLNEYNRRRKDKH